MIARIMRSRPPTATPTPIPIFAPVLRLEPLLLLLLSPDSPIEAVLVAVPVTLEPVSICVILPVLPDIVVALPVVPVTVVATVVVTSDAETVGACPTKNCTLSPVAVGNEAKLSKLFASLNCTVVLAASVHEHVAPACKVAGFPGCEQGAHSPSELSQSLTYLLLWTFRIRVVRISATSHVW
ncbi:hypothetical protein F5Y15DRAFT_399536 [Xylariaceae sp. FL0016]|nr:hypothetical protein F5Y15DRAFT_399536 [Xylariaceae sp. FL0016]